MKELLMKEIAIWASIASGALGFLYWLFKTFVPKTECKLSEEKITIQLIGIHNEMRTLKELIEVRLDNLDEKIESKHVH